MTSSTGGAELMARRLSYVREVLAPDLRAAAAPVQERWAAMAVAGPLARDVVAALVGEPAPRHMSAVAARVGDQRVLLLGASYSGERAFEIYAPSYAAEPVWTALAAAVAARGGGVYGLDAMDLLRIEKGHLVTGAEIDGRLSPYDLGLGKSLRAGGFIGWAGLQRPEFQRRDRPRLVGLEAVDGSLPEGAMLLANKGGKPQGHVSSAGRQVLGDGAIGLGLLAGGADRLNEMIIVASPTRGLEGRARVVAPVFHDPDGAAYRD
jgi:sarcosine oxidase subunit alpha